MRAFSAIDLYTHGCTHSCTPCIPHMQVHMHAHTLFLEMARVITKLSVAGWDHCVCPTQNLSQSDDSDTDIFLS